MVGPGLSKESEFYTLNGMFVGPSSPSDSVGGFRLSYLLNFMFVIFLCITSNERPVGRILISVLLLWPYMG